MNKHKSAKAYQQDLKGKFKNFRANPDKALAGAHNGTTSLWEKDKQWAITQLHKNLPEELAVSIYSQYVAKWDRYVSGKGQSKSANIWLRKRINMVKRAVALFPVPINELKHEGLRKTTARIWTDKCTEALVDSADAKNSIAETEIIVQQFADQWGFKPKTPTQEIEQLEGESKEDYEERVDNELAWFRLTRLVDEAWWERKIEIAYRQFCEHCHIINGRVRKGVSVYLSDAGLRDFRWRKIASTLALSKLVARNEETGEEIGMLDIVKGSIANPEVRRHELMVRMRGFEDIAQENKLMGGFFTLTAPSKYHAYTVGKNGKSLENKNYQGFSPKQTQQYLSATWAKARAKLKRMDIQLMGFRVCEPHHDGTPHWHALFFFKPEHEQITRYVLADYFTQTDRAELNVLDDEFRLWGHSFDKNGDQIIDLFADSIEEETQALIEDIAERISARFDYKRIDPEKGSATGYIAKYIAKNIDGYKMEDDQEEGTTADKAAEAVCGWSSLWRIRQFQQIGGPSVSVWRELRRLEQDKEVQAAKASAKEKGEKYVPAIRSFIDLQKQHDSIEVARIAADSGNWAMYIHAMGGIFCARADQPIRMVYKPVGNAYGEQVKKLKGIGTFDKTMITHSDAWTICKAGAEGGFDLKKNDSSFPWSSVNNCTGDENPTVEQAVIDQFKDLGIDLDESLLGPVMNGANILTGDGRRASLFYSDLGAQLRVEEIVADFGGEIEWAL